jgi:hypothetical protein
VGRLQPAFGSNFVWVGLVPEGNIPLRCGSSWSLKFERTNSNHINAVSSVSAWEAEPSSGARPEHGAAGVGRRRGRGGAPAGEEEVGRRRGCGGATAGEEAAAGGGRRRPARRRRSAAHGDREGAWPAEQQRGTAEERGGTVGSPAASSAGGGEWRRGGRRWPAQGQSPAAAGGARPSGRTAGG